MIENNSTIKRKLRERKNLELRDSNKPVIKYQSRTDNSNDNKNNPNYNETKIENTMNTIATQTQAPEPKKKSFFKRFILFTTFSALVVFVSLNFTPIVNYVINHQESNIFPVLKKYADQLRDISHQLTVVTRRLNMLSIMSEENELHDNNNKIGEMALQISQLWITTKRYLRYLGIETITNTKLEKEIDINSNIQDDDQITTKNSNKEILPNNELTLTSILRLDSVVNELNLKIKNLNSEINYLEERVYASINVSNIYTQLLDRNRRDNNNFYAEPDFSDNTNDGFVTNDQDTQFDDQDLITEQVRINSAPVAIKTKKPKRINTAPVRRQAKIIPRPKVEQQALIPKAIKKSQAIAKKPLITRTVPVKTQVPQKVAKIKPQFKKKQSLPSPITSSSVSKQIQTKVVTPKPIKNEPIVIDEPVFDNSALLDDIIYDYVSSNDYEEDEEDEDSSSNTPREDDDYTGG